MVRNRVARNRRATVTRTEAKEILRSKFPGLRSYIAVHEWVQDNGQTSPPLFEAVIYLSEPHNGKCDSVGAHGCATLEMAVRQAIEAGEKRLKQIEKEKHPEADTVSAEMFGELPAAAGKGA